MNTLRSLTCMCLLLILGATAVWIYWPGNRAIATIERAGGTVQVLTSPENRGAVAVTLPDTITDADLERMTALDKLQPVWVQLRGRQITGRSLACLKRLPS